MNRPDESPTPTPPVLCPCAGWGRAARAVAPAAAGAGDAAVAGAGGRYPGRCGGLAAAQRRRHRLAAGPGAGTGRARHARGPVVRPFRGRPGRVVRWDAWPAVGDDRRFAGDGLRWHWHPSSGAWVGLDARPACSAARVDVQTGPPGPRPVQMPRTLQLPLRLQAALVEVAELQIDALPPMQALRGRASACGNPAGVSTASTRWLRLGPRPHRRAGLAGRQPAVHAAGAGPAQRPATATPRWPTGPPRPACTDRWQRLRPAGHLARQGRAAPRPAPALDVERRHHAAGRRGRSARLRLRTQALDLSALASGAPQTALSGRMDIDSRSFSGADGGHIEAGQRGTRALERRPCAGAAGCRPGCAAPTPTATAC
jgi:hypothetical protein